MRTKEEIENAIQLLEAIVPPGQRTEMGEAILNVLKWVLEIPDGGEK